MVARLCPAFLDVPVGIVMPMLAGAAMGIWGFEALVVAGLMFALLSLAGLSLPPFVAGSSEPLKETSFSSGD